MGCIAFLFDVTGAGEADRLHPLRDFSGLQSLAGARTLLGWRVWDTMMALNHAWNEAGADPQKLAVIGSQGGALLPVLLGLQEPRVSAVVALNLLGEAGEGDSDLETVAHLRLGTGKLELCAALAPRALHVVSSGWEACARQAELAPLLREQWLLHERPDALSIDCRPTGRTPIGLGVREGIYSFLNRQFALGLEEPIEEGPIEALSTLELAVHRDDGSSGHPEERSAAEILEVNEGLDVEQLNLLIHEETPYRVSIFKRWIGAALATLLDTRFPSANEVQSRLVGYERRADRAVLRLALGRAGSGEEVPAILVVPDRWNRSLVLGVAPGGKADFFGQGPRTAFSDAARVVEQGAAFLAIDPFLTGEFLNVPYGATEAPSLPVDRARHGRSVAFTYAYNRTLLAERVHDVLTAIAFARSLEGVERVSLVGTGSAGPWALLARALAGEDTVERTAAQWSWNFSSLRSAEHPDFLPGGVRYGDLEYFASMIAPDALCLLGPGDRPMGIPEHVMRTYRSLEKAENVRSIAASQVGETLDWLAGAEQ
jgi:hypothetical protein